MRNDGTRQARQAGSAPQSVAAAELAAVQHCPARAGDFDTVLPAGTVGGTRTVTRAALMVGSSS